MLAMPSRGYDRLILVQYCHGRQAYVLPFSDKIYHNRKVFLTMTISCRAHTESTPTAWNNLTTSDDLLCTSLGPLNTTSSEIFQNYLRLLKYFSSLSLTKSNGFILWSQNTKSSDVICQQVWMYWFLPITYWYSRLSHILDLLLMKLRTCHGSRHNIWSVLFHFVYGISSVSNLRFTYI